MANAVHENAPVELESRPIGKYHTNMGNVPAQQDEFVIKEMVTKELSAVVDESLDDILWTFLCNTQMVSDQSCMTLLSR